MTISNDLLLGLVLGALLVLLFQQATKVTNRLMSPGCLLFIFILVVGFVSLIAVGVIDFQLFAYYQ